MGFAALRGARAADPAASSDGFKGPAALCRRSLAWLALPSAWACCAKGRGEVDDFGGDGAVGEEAQEVGGGEEEGGGIDEGVDEEGGGFAGEFGIPERLWR